MQGETGKWSVALVDLVTGGVLNLSGCSLRMAIHRTQPAPDVLTDSTAALVLSSPASGIQITDTLNGLVDITITDTQSAALLPPAYVFSLKLTNATSERYVVARGLLKVASQITHNS
jgi:hypothetical protein